MSQRPASRATQLGLLLARTLNERAPVLLGPAGGVLLAVLALYALLLVVGPISVVDAMPDLDLGGGISMTADGQIKVTNEVLPGPMRIPDRSGYLGVTVP